jgi:hypothetical protein
MWRTATTIVAVRHIKSLSVAVHVVFKFSLAAADATFPNHATSKVIKTLTTLFCSERHISLLRHMKSH